MSSLSLLESFKKINKETKQKKEELTKFCNSKVFQELFTYKKIEGAQKVGLILELPWNTIDNSKFYLDKKSVPKFKSQLWWDRRYFSDFDYYSQAENIEKTDAKTIADAKAAEQAVVHLKARVRQLKKLHRFEEAKKTWIEVEQAKIKSDEAKSSLASLAYSATRKRSSLIECENPFWAFARLVAQKRYPQSTLVNIYYCMQSTRGATPEQANVRLNGQSLLEYCVTDSEVFERLACDFNWSQQDYCNSLLNALSFKKNVYTSRLGILSLLNFIFGRITHDSLRLLLQTCPGLLTICLQKINSCKVGTANMIIFHSMLYKLLHAATDNQSRSTIRKVFEFNVVEFLTFFNECAAVQRWNLVMNPLQKWYAPIMELFESDNVKMFMLNQAYNCDKLFKWTIENFGIEWLNSFQMPNKLTEDNIFTCMHPLLHIIIHHSSKILDPELETDGATQVAQALQDLAKIQTGLVGPTNSSASSASSKSLTSSSLDSLNLILDHAHYGIFKTCNDKYVIAATEHLSQGLHGNQFERVPLNLIDLASSKRLDVPLYLSFLISFATGREIKKLWLGPVLSQIKTSVQLVSKLCDTMIVRDICPEILEYLDLDGLDKIEATEKYSIVISRSQYSDIGILGRKLLGPNVSSVNFKAYSDKIYDEFNGQKLKRSQRSKKSQTLTNIHKPKKENSLKRLKRKKLLVSNKHSKRIKI